MSTDPASEEYGHQVKSQSPLTAFTANDPGTSNNYIQCPLTLHHRNKVTKSSHSHHRLSLPMILVQVTTTFNVHQRCIRGIRSPSQFTVTTDCHCQQSWYKWQLHSMSTNSASEEYGHHRLLSLPMILVQATTTFNAHRPCIRGIRSPSQVTVTTDCHCQRSWSWYKRQLHSMSTDPASELNWKSYQVTATADHFLSWRLWHKWQPHWMSKDTQTSLLVSDIENIKYTYHTPPLPCTYTHIPPPPNTHPPTVHQPKNTFEGGSTKLRDVQFQIPGTGVAPVLALGLRQAAQTITPQGCSRSPAGYRLSVPPHSFTPLRTCLSHYTPAFTNTINTHGVGNVFSVVHFLFWSTGRAFLKRVTSFVRYCQHVVRFTLLKDPSLYHQTLVQKLLHSLTYGCDDVNAQRCCLNSQQCLLHNLEHCLCRFYQLKHRTNSKCITATQLELFPPTVNVPLNYLFQRVCEHVPLLLQRVSEIVPLLIAKGLWNCAITYSKGSVNMCHYLFQTVSEHVPLLISKGLWTCAITYFQRSVNMCHYLFPTVCEHVPSLISKGLFRTDTAALSHSSKTFLKPFSLFLPTLCYSNSHRHRILNLFLCLFFCSWRLHWLTGDYCLGDWERLSEVRGCEIVCVCVCVCVCMHVCTYVHVYMQGRMRDTVHY